MSRLPSFSLSNRIIYSYDSIQRKLLLCNSISIYCHCCYAGNLPGFAFKVRLECSYGCVHTIFTTWSRTAHDHCVPQCTLSPAWRALCVYFISLLKPYQHYRAYLGATCIYQLAGSQWRGANSSFPSLTSFSSICFILAIWIPVNSLIFVCQFVHCHIANETLFQCPCVC